MCSCMCVCVRVYVCLSYSCPDVALIFENVFFLNSPANSLVHILFLLSEVKLLRSHQLLVRAHFVSFVSLLFVSNF